MSLNTKQKAAVEYLDGPLLVLAGPGTGKTQLLSKKVEYILEKTDTDPSMILCITFTDAGAKNMKERLRSMIGQTTDKIDIMTFHSFGQKILSLYNQYSDQPQRIFSDAIEEVLQAKIISELQDNLPNSYLIKSNKNPKIILKAINRIKVSKLSVTDLRQIVKQNESDITRINQAVSPILQKLPARASCKNAFISLMETVYLPLLTALGELKTDHPIAGNIYHLPDILYEKIYSLIETQQSAERPSVSPINTFIKKYFSKDQHDEYKFSDLAQNKKLSELAELFEAYQTYLLEHNLYDFNDMIEMPIKYLEQDIDFRRKVAQNYLYIMVDEYQDTNPSQTKLLELIADEQESPSVMAVGDDDQSIFEFQGAKASSLIHFKDHFNAKVIVLTDNYRSTSEILKFSRKIADQLDESFIKNETMQRSLHTDNKTTEELKKELIAVRNQEILKNDPEDSLFEQKIYTDESLTPDQKLNHIPKTFIERHQFINQDAEYYWVAERVHQLIQLGVCQSEIGILFPKHAIVTNLIPYLKKYPEISISYERTENILENQQIRELLTLCQFIDQLSKGEDPCSMLPEILSFDFWSIPSDDVIMSIQSIHKNKRTALEILRSYHDHPLFAELAAFFTELARKSFELPLEYFLDTLTGNTSIDIKINEKTISFTSPFLKFYTKDLYSKATFDFYNRLVTLRNSVLSHTEKDKLRLNDLIQLLDDFEKTDTPITEQTFYQDSDDAVNLMTAHKSKGLEFKHVFLIGANENGWDNKKHQSGLSFPLNLEIIGDSNNTPDGKKRLFFVAITRAAKTLTITNPKFADDAMTKYNPLSFLNEKTIQESDSLKLSSPYIPSQFVVNHDTPLSDAEKIIAIKRTWKNKLLDPPEKIKPLLKERVKDLRLSASLLSSFIRLTYSGPLTFYLENIIHFSTEPTPSISLVYGNLIHHVFEEITKNQISKTDALNLYQEEAKQQDLLKEDIETLIERGQDELPLAIDAYDPILRAKGAKAEVDFSKEHLSFDGVPITGKIDHLNIDEENKTIDLFDFKTGTISDTDTWQSKESLYIYHFQLLFYRLLLKQSRIYRNYTVRSMHLLFTSPNRREVLTNPEGKMHDIELKESDIAKDSVNFDNLLLAVYYQITSLNFLDSNSPLNFKDINNASLADIKNFCQTLVEIYKNKAIDI